MPTRPLSSNDKWFLAAPNLYRYMSDRWVRSFFRDGSLRLSSFALFRRHADEQRLDTHEGLASIWQSVTAPDGRPMTMRVDLEGGSHGYVLCAAMRHDPVLMNAFQCDSYIRIWNTTKFGESVAKCLPGFVRGVEGPCLYQAQRAVVARSDGSRPPVVPASLKTREEVGEWARRVAIRNAEHYLLFLKHTSYAHQSEYRMLWFVDSPVTGHIDIKAPDAREFCTPPSNVD
jgi:hypothetical protein